MTGSDGGMKKEGSPDINSPFYIHASDYPKQMHVNDTITDNNYTDWSQEMLNFLFAKNKAGFIDGTLMKPEKTATDYMAWMRCDAMVKGWLTTAMKKDIRSSVKHANIASEIWSDLRESYESNIDKNALDFIKTGHERNFKDASEITNVLEFILPTPPLFLVVKKAPPESVAFKAFKPVRREHNVSQNKNVPKYQKRGDTEEKCTECGRIGHTRYGCFKIIGYPEWWPGKVKPRGAAHVETEASLMPGLTKEQYHSFFKHFAQNDVKDGSVRMANMEGKRGWDNDWAVDSGSTEHITHDEIILNNKIVCSNEEPVVIPNGDAIHVKGKGECTLEGESKLKGVLYIPEYNCNLLSKLHTRSLIGAGKYRKSLYRMGLLNDERRAMMTTENTWHKRLRHASEDKLVAINFLKSITLDKLCDSCSKAKQTRLPFSDRFEANLPKRFWGECILTATYIINRLPSKVIDDKTPFELVFNQKPDYDNMQFFGCLTYHRNTDTRGDKFEEKGKPRVFIGYPQRTKGYKVLDIKTSKIIISIDTKSFKEKFPFNGDNLIYVEETNKNSMVNEPNELDGTNDTDEPNVNPTLNENEAEDILSETSSPLGDTTEKLARTPERLVLSQRKYIQDILEDCGFQGCRPSPFPFKQNLILDKRDKEPKVDAGRYRRLVGRLLYLQATRPDIAYSINVLSQFMADPRHSHMDAAHQVLRRSRTGYLLLFKGSPISWKTKKQNVVSRSSAKAEYKSMASTVNEIIWMLWLLKELTINLNGPTSLFCDNQAARHIANNPVFHERTKHAEIPYLLSIIYVDEPVSTIQKSFASLVINEAVTSKDMIVAIPNMKDDNEILHMNSEVSRKVMHSTNAFDALNMIEKGDESGSYRGSPNSGKKVVQDVVGSTSHSPSNTSLVARINDLKSQMIEKKHVLLDDEGKR
uniref:Uncharacterized protein n=1 Tax=Tanacetum cinerariifolium TaxID=118510 RepID=A0A6L2P2G9_TANCI|nr:hypothetical protein [Tanacetum cinerariifolium]